MVKGPDEPVFRFTDMEHRHPHERRRSQLESAPPFRFEIRLPTVILLAFGQTAPILLLEMKPGVTMHLLAGLRVVPMKTRPQDGMPFHSVFPRLAKNSGAQILRQRANHLFDVHTGVRRGEAVEQHALLHRGKRVALCNVIRRPDLVLVRHIDAHNRLLREMA